MSEEIDVARARKALDRADHADPVDTAAARTTPVRCARPARPGSGAAGGGSSGARRRHPACRLPAAGHLSGRAAGAASSRAAVWTWILRRRPGVAGDPKSGSSWLAGMGRYRGDDLAWFRFTSLWPGPTVVVDGTVLEIVGRRSPTDEVRRDPRGGRRAALPDARGCPGAGDASRRTDGLPLVAGGHSAGRTGYRQAS